MQSSQSQGVLSVGGALPHDRSLVCAGGARLHHRGVVYVCAGEVRSMAEGVRRMTLIRAAGLKSHPHADGAVGHPILSGAYICAFPQTLNAVSYQAEVAVRVFSLAAARLLLLPAPFWCTHLYLRRIYAFCPPPRPFHQRFQRLLRSRDLFQSPPCSLLGLPCQPAVK